ncbi:hypothetical protein HK099_006603 [Clydaea vesicula]|uniref:Uncharacterized protein n=1 Tax=Clydaea vesicula TaxID=447962 RepID=A0AAD5TYP8_9FUNG|nr:hypothetical protein HK099_006603 [Clydaea vesicula]
MKNKSKKGSKTKILNTLIKASTLPASFTIKNLFSIFDQSKSEKGDTQNKQNVKYNRSKSLSTLQKQDEATFVKQVPKTDKIKNENISNVLTQNKTINTTLIQQPETQNFTSSQQLTNETIKKRLPSTTSNSSKNKKSQKKIRSVSTPIPAKTVLNLDSDEEEDNDPFEEDDEISIKNFIVSSVKMKVMESNSKSTETLNKTETWDDDFFEDEDASDTQDFLTAKMPFDKNLVHFNKCNSNENKIKMDGLNMKKFFWHVEDLKLLYTDAVEISNGIVDLEKKKKNLILQYLPHFKESRVIIDFSEQLNDTETTTKLNKNKDFFFSEYQNEINVKNDLKVLKEILISENSEKLKKDNGNSDTFKASSKTVDENDEEWSFFDDDKKDLFDDDKLEFTVEFLPNLIKKINVLKTSIEEFKIKLRKLFLQQS